MKKCTPNIFYRFQKNTFFTFKFKKIIVVKRGCFSTINSMMYY